nr:MAG TPA: hypothetical protein [Caudoviricetes sp.]
MNCDRVQVAIFLLAPEVTLYELLLNNCNTNILQLIL